jgi:tetratricopeptide (TPR) repeat protein
VNRALLTLAFLGALAATAGADPSADDHEKAAAAFFKVGNFEGALAEFRAAYELDPKPDYLYAMATIEEQRGACAAAIDLYQQFLDTRPPAEDVEVVEAAIATCKAKLGEPEPEPVVPEPRPPEPTPEPRPLPPPTRRVQRPFYSDVLGDALVGAGGVGIGVGVVFYVLARGDARDAADPGPRETYDQLWQRAQDRQRIAAIATGAGAALVIGGVVRWITADRWEVIPDVGAEHASLVIASRW